MKKRLHELIEMSCNGEKFEATHEGRSNYVNQEYFKGGDFTKEEVLAEWTVRMKREPRVIWVNEKLDGSLEAVHNFTENLAKLNREPRCRTIKFIEVLDEP